jgi:acyl transferase domain-containing protein
MSTQTLAGDQLNGCGSSNGVSTSTPGTTPPEMAHEPIAIVGMGMRLPGKVHTSDQLWQLLMDKKAARSKIPASRFNVKGFRSTDGTPGTMAVEEGHFLDDDDHLEHFDISLFSAGQKEVEAVDPQQKMLAEVVWECMENAGQANWRGTNIGVFVGAFGDVGFSSAV